MASPPWPIRRVDEPPSPNPRHVPLRAPPCPIAAPPLALLPFVKDPPLEDDDPTRFVVALPPKPSAPSEMSPESAGPTSSEAHAATMVTVTRAPPKATSMMLLDGERESMWRSPSATGLAEHSEALNLSDGVAHT